MLDPAPYRGLSRVVTARISQSLPLQECSFKDWVNAGIRSDVARLAGAGQHVARDGVVGSGARSEQGAELGVQCGALRISGGHGLEPPVEDFVARSGSDEPSIHGGLVAIPARVADETQGECRQMERLGAVHANPSSQDALAAALDDYAGLADLHRERLAQLGAFDEALIDEARALAVAVREVSAKKLAGASTDAQKRALELAIAW